MVRHVRQAFREILQEVPWLEESTKKVAQEKVISHMCKLSPFDLIDCGSCECYRYIQQLLIASIRMRGRSGNCVMYDAPKRIVKLNGRCLFEIAI